jgi:hypothetical protein
MACFRLSVSSSRRDCWRKDCSISSVGRVVRRARERWPLGSFPATLRDDGYSRVPARTGNRPAAIQRFQPIHDSRQIFNDGQVTPGEAGLRGTLLVTFEEGTWAAWLYGPLKPHVAKVVVCNPSRTLY